MPPPQNGSGVMRHGPVAERAWQPILPDDYSRRSRVREQEPMNVATPTLLAPVAA